MMRFKVGFAWMLGVCAALMVPTPAALAYSAFVTNEKDNTVSVIDTDKLEVIKTFKVGHRPRGIILSKDAKWLIICASDDNVIQVYTDFREVDGVTYPFEVTSTFNGEPITSATTQELTFNAAVAEDAFAAPEAMTAAKEGN